MPVAKTQSHAGQRDEARFGNAPPAVQSPLRDVPVVPPADFFPIVHILPQSQFLHARSFLGLAGRFSARYGRLVAVHAQRWVSITCKIIIFPS